MRMSKFFLPSSEQLEELENLKERGYARSELPVSGENFPLDCLRCGSMIRYPDVHDKVCPAKISHKLY